MSDRCVRCGKAAVVRRVLPPTDPMGVAGGPQPVCMGCAELVDNAADGLTPSPAGPLASSPGSAPGVGAGWILMVVAGVLFVGALIAFIATNRP